MAASETKTETTHQSGPFPNAEAKSRVSELRSKGIHAWTRYAKDPTDLANDWRTMDLYVLEQYHTINI